MRFAESAQTILSEERGWREMVSSILFVRIAAGLQGRSRSRIADLTKGEAKR